MIAGNVLFNVAAIRSYRRDPNSRRVDIIVLPAEIVRTQRIEQCGLPMPTCQLSRLHKRLNYSMSLTFSIYFCCKIVLIEIVINRA